MRVLSDTSPLNYLVQIGLGTLPAALFRKVLIADAVGRELGRPQTPTIVRDWFAARPHWVTVESSPGWNGAPLPRLHDGERETLELALTTGSDLILMDDRAGVVAARARGLRVTGTLGILDLAADRKLIDVSESLMRLRATNFRVDPDLIAALLTGHRSTRRE